MSNVANDDANAHEVTDAHKAAPEEMTEMYQPAAATAAATKLGGPVGLLLPDFFFF